MKKKPFINKKSFKRKYKRCAICHESDYDLLDVHRWKTFGCEGGKYSSDNSIVLCTTCHRLLHKEKIKILGIYMSTTGEVVNFINKNGEEEFQTL